MAKATHKPPARVRYEQSHPTVSFRLPRDLYDQLKEGLANREVTFADFVKEALDAQQFKMPDIARIKRLAHDKGYREAKEKYQIWCFCAGCRERINITPNSNIHNAVIRLLREAGWGHEACVS